MATIEEQYKLAANTRFAVLARALADNDPGSAAHKMALSELALQRSIEYERRSRQEMLATLGRMIGDALLKNQDHRAAAARSARGAAFRAYGRTAGRAA
jgi:hypothetical protein